MAIAERLMISKEKKVCVNCKYFVQHYIYDKRFNNDFSPCNDGHCVKPRLKKIESQKIRLVSILNGIRRKINKNKPLRNGSSERGKQYN